LNLPVFILVLTAALLHAFWNFAARKVAGNLAVMWLGLSVASMLCLPLAIAFRPSMESIKSAVPFMLATGVIHALYFGMLSKGYEKGEISLVYPMARGTGVVGTSLAAYILINEDISWLGAIGILAISSGIFAVGFQGLKSQEQFKPAVLSLFIGCTIAGYSLVDKVGVGRIHPVSYIFSMFFLAALFLTPSVALNHRARCVDALKNMKRYILLIGPGSMGTYLIILFAFQLGKVSYIVATREFSVVIGSALGILILRERLTWKKVFGISVITFGLILVKVTG
jgi:drug/metabolite transporter (DMT)-like permease